MSKFNMLALVCFVGGAVAVVFQAISSMMTVGTITWEPKTLVTLLGDDRFQWVNDISITFFYHIAHFLVNLQVFLLAFILGAIFLVLGMIFKD
ncbi:MAG: hypothetical protein LJE65_05435 [Desulfobacteraceae bacterium]|nr:hypothetical protein [Desulfobacteraceae bacterium]